MDRIQGVSMVRASGSWATLEAEHGSIIELLNRARVLALRDSSRDSLLPTYQAIVKKFEEHFEHEERMMEATGYPDAQAHHRHHQVLLIRLLSLCDRMKSPGSVEIEELRVPFQTLFDDAVGADASFKAYLDEAAPV
jgi:hemerythrin-like metal-binding protein